MTLFVFLGIVVVVKLATKQDMPTSQGMQHSKTQSYTGERLRLKTFFGPTWSVVIPSGWQIARKDFASGSIFVDELTYDANVGTVYTDKIVDRDIERFSVSYGDSSLFPDEYNTYKKTSFKTDTLSGYQYFHQFSAGEKIGSYVMKGGERDYTYYFVKDDLDVTLSYFVLDGDKDQRELVEEVVGTLHYEPVKQQ